MLLHLFLLFFLCKSTVTFLTTLAPREPTDPVTARATAIVGAITSHSSIAELSSLQLVANPDYPVAAGQKVHLHCRASTILASINWSWQHLENQTWQQVYSGLDLTLNEPKQSGLYRCVAEDSFSKKKIVSLNHTVYIISMQPTDGEILGTVAFILSLLVLIINLIILLWLVWQRLSNTMTTSNTAAKGFSGPEKPPNGGLPKINNDNDVYMNYTNTNQAYSDLDPTNMTGDNVYSCLS